MGLFPSAIVQATHHYPSIRECVFWVIFFVDSNVLSAAAGREAFSFSQLPLAGTHPPLIAFWRSLRLVGGDIVCADRKAGNPRVYGRRDEPQIGQIKAKANGSRSSVLSLSAFLYLCGPCFAVGSHGISNSSLWSLKCDIRTLKYLCLGGFLHIIIDF